MRIILILAAFLAPVAHAAQSPNGRIACFANCQFQLDGELHQDPISTAGTSPEAAFASAKNYCEELGGPTAVLKSQKTSAPLTVSDCRETSGQ